MRKPHSYAVSILVLTTILFGSVLLFDLFDRRPITILFVGACAGFFIGCGHAEGSLFKFKDPDD